jgi:hypothetical protein
LAINQPGFDREAFYFILQGSQILTNRPSFGIGPVIDNPDLFLNFVIKPGFDTDAIFGILQNSQILTNHLR